MSALIRFLLSCTEAIGWLDENLLHINLEYRLVSFMSGGKGTIGNPY